MHYSQNILLKWNAKDKSIKKEKNGQVLSGKIGQDKWLGKDKHVTHVHTKKDFSFYEFKYIYPSKLSCDLNRFHSMMILAKAINLWCYQTFYSQ